jgi:SAM-dependent methyltransferase
MTVVQNPRSVDGDFARRDARRPDFSRRSAVDELMDTEPLDYEEFRAVLVDLARVNRLTIAHRPTLAFLDRLAAAGLPKGRPLEIVDVGSGYGDLLRAIGLWASRRGIAVSLTGVDLNPWSARAATEATPAGQPVTWVTADAFAYAPPHGIDVVVSSLFTHHLPDRLVAQFLAWMDQHARVGWFINDLHRHPVPYYFFRTWSRLAHWHRFIRHDGPVSIARAFDPADWRRLLAQAQVDPATVAIRRRFPFRLTLGKVVGPVAPGR